MKKEVLVVVGEFCLGSSSKVTIRMTDVIKSAQDVFKKVI